MRIENLTIRNWRQVGDVDIRVTDESNIVAIVGENGVGKSNILQLISECLLRIGLQNEQHPQPKSRMREPHELSLSLDFSDQLEIMMEMEYLEGFWSHKPNATLFDDWDGRVGVESSFTEGDLEPELVLQVGDYREKDTDSWSIRALLSNLSTAHMLRHLHLDANRVFEQEEDNWAYIIEQGLGKWTPEIQRMFSYRETKDLFRQWQSWLHQTEVAAGMDLVKTIRRGGADHALNTLSPDDLPHAQYAQSLHRALPHLQFLGADPQEKSIKFASHGQEVEFFDLSAGEREIAYILGQIDRFNLVNGILLIDEPELHLHPRLVTGWVQFLETEINKGQVWIATHSYEAVEAIGLTSTHVLVSDPVTNRTVVSKDRNTGELRRRLFDSIGVPGLTLHGKTLVIVEGGSKSEERHRFQQLTDSPAETVFLSHGENKDEVQRSTEIFSELEDASDQTIHVRGVIDADYTSCLDIDGQYQDRRVFQLRVHEVENLYLFPPLLEHLSKENGLAGFSWEEVVGTASDRLAGMWVFGHASYGKYHDWARTLGDYSLFEKLQSQFNGLDRHAVGDVIQDLDIPSIRDRLFESASTFARMRSEREWWMHLPGKQVLRMIPKNLGYTNKSFLEAAAHRCWRENPRTVPSDIVSLRKFIVN